MTTRPSLPLPVLLAGAPLIFGNGAAAAAQDAGLPRIAALEQMTVTATRTPRSRTDSLASVSIIDRAEIEASQADSLAGLLRGLPGVEIANSGGLGQATSIFLRGTESDHVLVLIDGVRMGSVSLGTASFQDLPLSQIERIEIVRGPRSALYGSEAIGGVIQIFTRQGRGEPAPDARLGYGSYHTLEGSAGYGGRTRWGDLHGGLSHTRSDGFDACRPDPGFRAGCFADQPDDDGYRRSAASLRAGIDLPRGARLDLSALRSQGGNQFDGSFQDSSDFVQQALGATLALSPSARWDVRLRAGQSRDDLTSYLDGAFASRFDSRRDSASWQNDLALGVGLLSLGLDWYDDRVDSNTAFAETSRANTGAFAQLQGTLGRNELTLSARHDDNEQFGGHSTWGLGWGHPLGGRLRLTASLGTAFKAPSFNDLYFPFFGNPDLDPETSTSAELGLRGGPGWGSWSASAFATRIDDLIAFNPTTQRPENINQASIRGLELSLSTTLAGWELTGHATLLDPEDSGGGATDGNRLPRRAERSLRLTLDRRLGRWQLGLTGYAEGPRYDDPANTVRMAGYGLLDLRAGYRLGRRLHLQLKVGNLFDRDYETVAFYNQPGRHLMVSLRYGL